MAFCRACIAWSKDNVFKASLYGPADWRRLHDTLPRFFESNEGGCPICARLYQLLSAQGKQHIQLIRSALSTRLLEEPRDLDVVRLRPLFFGFDHGSKREGREVIINAEIGREYFKAMLPLLGGRKASEDLETSIQVLVTEVDKYNMVGSNLFLTPRVAIDTYDAVWRRPESPSTASDETLSTMQGWIRDCTLKHSQCIARRQRRNWYPTRLLDVGISEDGSSLSNYCRLASNASVPEGQNYLTLSHRWGSYAVVKLTTGNMKTWEKALPIESLSKTFQDFIQLSRRMGIRYVWIDSLCIIQEGDGGADWTREAATMADIYTNAYCNVSADWGTEQNGLFFVRDMEDFDIPCLDVTVDVDGEKVVESYVTIDGPATGFWNNQVTHSPLNGRAWVLQERLLAPRILHFGPQEVLFECCETAACERYPKGLPLPEFSGDAPLPKIFKPSDTNSYIRSLTERWKPENIVPEVTRYIWPDIVAQYSRCHLTYASDKLVAISGIARYFQALDRHNIYVAGLWANTIAAEMAWHRSWVDSRVPEFQRNLPVATQGFVKDRAPSFSWASTDFPVTAGETLAEGILPTVCCFQYRSRADAPLAPIVDSIFGPLFKPAVELQVVGCLKQATLQKVEDRILAIPFTERGSTTLWPVNLDAVPDSEDIDHLQGETVYYLPWQIDHVTSRFVAIFFRLVDQDMARFQRIGIMRSGNIELKELYMRTQGNEAVLPCKTYNATTMEHEIYIV